MLQVYIETYGCSNNLAESEIIKALLSIQGCSFTNNLDLAEVIIVNTCIVKSKTISKIKRRIQDLMPKFDNGRKIIIAGCMPETLLDEIIKLSPNSSIISTHQINRISFVIDNVLKGKRIVLTGKENLIKCSMPKIRNNKLITIIPISSGCDGTCSYCLTRLAKGPLFSYKEEDIIKQIESDLQSGAKEIWLTSQDCAAYGIDKISREDASQKPLGVGDKLPELLNKILSLKHNFKLRLGMSNPNHIYSILNDLIQIYKNDKMYKFLHMPIQSASDKILKDMNRKYKIKQAEEIITKFRKEFPDIVIATDIITGYPTETSEDHKFNIDFINSFKPDVLNLSKFSSHKNTKAGKLKPLDTKIINKRASELMEIHRQTAQNNKQKYKDKQIEVFIDKKISENLYESRDDNYNIVLMNSKDRSILGKNLMVKIKQIGVHHMQAEAI